MTITEEKHFSHDGKRDKKLLLRRKELNKLQKDLIEGMTIVVKKVFLKIGEKLKLKWRLQYDKRNSIKEKEIKRNLKNY